MWIVFTLAINTIRIRLVIFKYIVYLQLLCNALHYTYTPYKKLAIFKLDKSYVKILIFLKKKLCIPWPITIINPPSYFQFLMYVYFAWDLILENLFCTGSWTDLLSRLLPSKTFLIFCCIQIVTGVPVLIAPSFGPNGNVSIRKNLMSQFFPYPSDLVPSFVSLNLLQTLKKVFL